MKNLISLLLLFAIPVFVFSQTRTSEQEKKDKKKLDSLCRKTPSICSDYKMLIGVNSVFYDLKEIKLKPKERHCFDKKINYRGLVNNRPVNGCYYVNTNDGLIARREDKSCNGLMDFEKGYRMSMYSMQGDAFIYEVDNRENYRFLVIPSSENLAGNNTTFSISDFDAFRSGNAEKLTDHNLPAFQYKILESTQDAQYFLFAPYLEERIAVMDYLGMFGTGYYKDKFGNTIISLLMISDPQNYIRIEKISEVNECFDGSAFNSFADEAGNAENEISGRRQTEFDERMNSNSGGCAARTQLVTLERKMQDKSDRAMSIAKSGKPHSQADIDALLDGNNVLDEVEIQILKLQVKLCSLQDAVSSPNTSPESKAHYAREIGCIHSSITKLKALKSELEAIKIPNPKEKGRVLVLRSKHYFTRIAQIDLGCNANKSGDIKKIPEVKNPIPDSKNPLKKLKSKR